MALSGYQDGNRFLIDGQDPALAKAQQQIQQLTMMLKKLQIEKGNKHEANDVNLKKSHETNLTKLAIADKTHESKARLALFEHIAGQEVAEDERDHAVEDRDAGFEHDSQMQKEKPSAAQSK
jgi:hypothetical protein